MSDFILALKKEIQNRKTYIDNEEVKTIYFGGGTPSLLPASAVDDLLELLNKNYNIVSNPEITVETNPDTIDKDKMLAFKSLGVNRISVGIQSFFDDDLRYLGRKHDSIHAISVIDELKDVGFEKLTIDLIYGMPTLTDEKWNKNLDIFFSKEISHLSAYSLTIEPNTILYHKIQKDKTLDINDEDAVRHYNILTNRCRENGFEHYEVSNFAKNNCRSQHNCIYWNDENYIGFGPSAHSYNNHSRQWNISNLSKYIENVNTDKDYFEKEILTLDNKFDEYILTSLRTSWGCDAKKIQSDYGDKYYEYFLKKIDKYLQNGDVIRDGNNFCLTENAILFSDAIIADLFL